VVLLGVLAEVAVAPFWCDYIAEKLTEISPETDEEMGDEEKREAKEAEELAERMTGYLLGRLEGFGDETAQRIESLFKEVGTSLSYEFEHLYVRDMLTRIPKMVARTMKLSQVITREDPSGWVGIYLKEATRCYIFGFWDASVALCRAAVEQGVREVVRKKLNQSPANLTQTVKLADRSRLLDKSTSHLAGKVILMGNRVLHGSPTNERGAWDVLCAARGVLQHLFAAA
jgi:putative methionine-R-sulfoxide reductase with GAF domain